MAITRPVAIGCIRRQGLPNGVRKRLIGRKVPSMNKTFVLLLAMLLLAAAMFGQALTSLTGTVVDPSGALVPGASISIQNNATHATRDTVSDSSGRYSLLQVQPGIYTVTAKSAGLADVMVNRVELLVSTPATLTIAFEKV